MAEEHALLDQIIANPDDDRPRLVYADWLIQRGDPRGELVVVQCALARHARGDDDVGDVTALVRRERALLDANLGRWIAPARAILGRTFELRRGFIEKVLVNQAHDLIAVADRLWEVAPGLRALGLGTGFSALAASPVMQRIDEIESLSNPRVEDLEALASSPHQLRRLEIHKASPHASAIAAIVELPHALDALVLGFDGRTVSFERRPMIQRLLACPTRRSLRVLRVRQLRHLDELALGIAHCAQLEELELENADLTGAGLLAIARGLPRLRSLDLSDNYRSDLALDAGAFMAAIPVTLRALRLSRMGLDSTHARAIAEAPSATQLRRLDLSRNKLDDAGALAIARSPQLANLVALNLNANGLTEDAKRAVRESPHLTRAKIQLR